jgi:hypothetical protein
MPSCVCRRAAARSCCGAPTDYPGGVQHPKVIGAMVETATRMGTGAGGARNIIGTTHPLVELERELADPRPPTWLVREQLDKQIGPVPIEAFPFFRQISRTLPRRSNETVRPVRLNSGNLFAREPSNDWYRLRKSITSIHIHSACRSDIRTSVCSCRTRRRLGAARPRSRVAKRCRR